LFVAAQNGHLEIVNFLATLEEAKPHLPMIEGTLKVGCLKKVI
jgi:hypothetical protein